MSNMRTCKHQECNESSVFNSDFCWSHISDKSAYRDSVLSAAEQNGSLKGVNLSRVDLSELNLAKLDFSGANLSRTNLSNAILFDSNLKNADLLGADLSDCDLTSANLEGSDLTRSSLRGARLWHANLENTNLIEANLNRCDFWNAKLFNTRFWRTDLSGALSIDRKSFQSNLKNRTNAYRINEKGILSAEEAYRDLKRYFLANGKYNDASWASFKEKSMEKLLLKKKRNIAYLPSLIMGLLCGYGEKPHRIILSSFFVVLFFALIFFILNGVIYQPADTYTLTIGDYLYYSIITFTTVGYGDFIPKSSLLFRTLAASEAFIGTFMIGLFIFTLARKYSAR